MIHSLVHWGSAPKVPSSATDKELGFAEGELVCVHDQLLPIYQITVGQHDAAADRWHVTLTKLEGSGTPSPVVATAPDTLEFYMDDPDRWVLVALGACMCPGWLADNAVP